MHVRLLVMREGANRIHRAELPLLIATFLDLFGFGMIISDIQLRIESMTPTGFRPGAVVGMILASTFVVQTFATPFWGRQSDRIGRKPLIVGLTLLSAVAMIVYGLAPNVIWILASRILAGASSANVAVAQAFVADLDDGSHRAVVMGRIGAAISAGLVLGPVLGGFVGSTYGGHAVGLTAGIASLLGAVLMAALLPTAKPTHASEPSKHTPLNLGLLRDLPAIRPLAIISVVAWFSLAMLEGTFARLISHLYGMNQKQFGFIFGYESFLGVVVQSFVIGLLIARFRDRTLLIAAYAMQGIGLALNPGASLVSHWVSPMVFIVLASTIYALGAGIANPTINGLMSNLCPDDRQGEMFGLLQGARSIGFVVGPILGGMLFDAFPAAPYLFAGGVCLGAAVLAGRMVANVPRVKAQTT